MQTSLDGKQQESSVVCDRMLVRAKHCPALNGSNHRRHLERAPLVCVGPSSIPQGGSPDGKAWRANVVTIATPE
jgi:hypothetical protein